MALPLGLAGLCVGLVVAGIGSSIQHPRASLLVTDSYGDAARRPLGIYNFAGDLGKAVLPALVALLLTVLAWRPVLGLMAMLGAAFIRSEEHTSELQSLMRISSAVFCLEKKHQTKEIRHTSRHRP